MLSINERHVSNGCDRIIWILCALNEYLSEAEEELLA